MASDDSYEYSWVAGGVDEGDHHGYGHKCRYIVYMGFIYNYNSLESN